MKYIIHHRLKGSTISGQVNLPYGTKLVSNDNRFIIGSSGTICVIGSEQYNQHIAPNDDNNGLERGAITYAIAYKNTPTYSSRGQRFTEEQINILTSKYQRFLVPDVDAILFNTKFFNAPIEDLRTMAKDLNIKIKN